MPVAGLHSGGSNVDFKDLIETVGGTVNPPVPLGGHGDRNPCRVRIAVYASSARAVDAPAHTYPAASIEFFQLQEPDKSYVHANLWIMDGQTGRPALVLDRCNAVTWRVSYRPDITQPQKYMSAAAVIDFGPSIRVMDETKKILYSEFSIRYKSVRMELFDGTRVNRRKTSAFIDRG
jgi:hypothetical protein